MHLLVAGLLLTAFSLAQPSSQFSQEAVTSGFLAGQKAMQAGDFREAETAYRDVLELAPELSEARANLGLVLFLQGKFTETVEQLARVTDEKPELPAAHLFLGLGHLRLGSPAKAIPSLEQALEYSPDNLEARRALAACYLAESNYAGAVREFQAAFSHERDKTEAWFRLGRDYMNLMSELAGGLVVGQPDSVWASRLGADMLGLSEAWEAAIPYYETALARRPDLPGLRASLGHARLRLGDLKAAEEAFRAELQLNRRSERALLGLASASLARGDAGAALEYVGRVWEYFPQGLLNRPDFPAHLISPDSALGLIARLPEADGAPSRFLQSILFERSGNEARAVLQRSLLAGHVERTPAPDPGTLSPEERCSQHLYKSCVEELESRPTLSRAALLALGKAYLALGQEERAVIAFTHAMRGAEDGSPEAVYWTVRTLQALADRCFRQVGALAPGSWRVHQLRAEAHRQRQADDEAISEYRRAIDLKPDEAELHRSLGLLYLLNNAYDEAERAFERALALDSSNARTLYFVGRLFIARQQHAASIEYFETALRLDPNLIEARPSLGRAYLRVGRFEEAAAELKQGLAFDYYGDIHYSLFQAYRQLGDLDEAKKALDRSTAMRRSSFARDRSKFDRWIKSE